MVEEKVTEEKAPAEEEVEEPVEEELAEEELRPEEAEEEVETTEEAVEEEKYRPPKPVLTNEEARLLRLRSEMNRKRPRFIRMNSWYLARLPDSWRSPAHSLDNKIRTERKGYPKRVKIGYRNPRLVRGLHPSGFEEVLVYNAKGLEELDPTRQAIRIASTVGRRKRAEIIRRARELGLKILNLGGAYE